MANKTVSNTTPRAIIEACMRSGIDIGTLLSEANLTQGAIENPNGRTLFTDVIRLWEKSFKHTEDRMIGVKAAKYLPFGAFKVIDYMMASSETPGAGLSKALSYYPLINEGFEVSINVNNKGSYVRLQNPTDPDIVPFQYVDFVFACILTRIRFSTSFDWAPSEIWLTCSRPADTSGYNRFFKAPIRFGQDINRMVFEEGSMEIPQPNADPRLCEMLDNHAQHLVTQLPSEVDILHELGRILRENLAHGEFGLNSSARKIGMSRRSLQRQLKTKGVSYREMLNQIRCEVATDLLGQKNTSVEETAFLVGYSEKSTFYRAFKAWTGKTPNDFINH